MKLLFLLLVLLTACSPKSPGSRQKLSGGDDSLIMELAPSTINLEVVDSVLTGSVDNGAAAVDFGPLYLGAKISKQVIISAKSNIPVLDISGFINASKFLYKSSTCNGSLLKNRACVVTIEFTPTTTGPLTELISVNQSLNFSLVAEIIPVPVISSATQNENLFLSTSSMDLGSFNGLKKTARITISNNNKTAIDISVQATNLIAEGFVFVSYCPVKLGSKRACQIEVSYSSSLEFPQDVVKNTSFLINNLKTITVDLTHLATVQVEDFNFFWMTNPVNLGVIAAPRKQIIYVKNLTGSDLTSLNFSALPAGVTISRKNCMTSLRSKFDCYVEFSFDNALMTNGPFSFEYTYSNSKRSAKLNLNMTISGGINPVASLPCELSDAQLNGWNIQKANEASGLKTSGDVSACNLATCIEGYAIHTDSRKCLVNIDPENDGVVTNDAFNKLITDAASGYVSSTITLDPNKIYEFDEQISVPANVIIQGPSPAQKVTIRKKTELMNGVDKSIAQTLKTSVVSALPLIAYDANGDVISYNGQTTVAALQSARTALTNYFEANNLLDPLVVTYGSKKFRFDVDGYGTRCKNAAGESYVCPDVIPTGTIKFTPFFQEILNTPIDEFSQYNRNSVDPIFYVASANVKLRNLNLACANDAPYFPILEMVNISVSKPNGEPATSGGSRVAPGFAANAIYLSGASFTEIDNVKTENCSLGIYSINSNTVELTNNEILTNVKNSSLRPLSNKEQGDFGVMWKHRFHGINAIRIHGTQDRNFLIQNNIVGSDTSGAQKGIHIHGTSLSGRDHDHNGMPDSPAQGFTANDQGLLALASYADRSDEMSVMRKNFKVVGNTFKGHHISGIDFEGDQLNAEIKNNIIYNIQDKFFIPTATNSQDSGIGVRILSEVSPLAIFNLFASGTAYNLDFVGTLKNVLISGNTISDSFMGIAVYNKQNDQALAFDNFPVAPASPVNTNYNCSLSAMLPSCSNQMSILNNTISRMKSNPIALASHPTTIALQSYGILISGSIGAEVKNNALNTCNVPTFDYSGNPSAIYVISSKKVHFNNNPISIDSSTQSARLALGTTSGTNRYYGIRFTGTVTNSSSVTRMVDSEVLISGCVSNISCLSTYNFKTSAGGRLSDANYINENPTTPPADAVTPYKFIPSLELNNILE